MHSEFPSTISQNLHVDFPNGVCVWGGGGGGVKKGK